MERNTPTKWRVYAYDRTTGAPKDGDAANITARLTLDNNAPAVTDDVNPSEVDAVNEKGYYDFNIIAAENNGVRVTLSPSSSTANIAVVACPPAVYTRPENFSKLEIDADGNLPILTQADGIEAGWSLQAILRIISAAMAGPTESLGGGQWTFRDVNDTKVRITVTIVNSERTVVVLDAT